MPNRGYAKSDIPAVQKKRLNSSLTPTSSFMIAKPRSSRHAHAIIALPVHFTKKVIAGVLFGDIKLLVDGDIIWPTTKKLQELWLDILFPAMYELVTLKQQEHDLKSVNAAHPKRMSLHYLRYAVTPWSTTCPLDNMVACVEYHSTFHHLVLSAGSTFLLRTSILSNIALVQSTNPIQLSRHL